MYFDNYPLRSGRTDPNPKSTMNCPVKFRLFILCILSLSAGHFTSASMNFFTETWESGSTSGNWHSWGWPSPVLSSSANAVGSYSMDPNGDSSYHSGMVSSQMYTLSAGVSLTVAAYIESAAQWSELNFGITDSNSFPTNPNTNEFSIATLTIDADTQNTGHKLFANFTGSGGTQTVSDNEAATAFFDAWHNYTFTFLENGSATIAIDNETVFTSSAGLFDYSVDSSFSILLAGRSYGVTTNLYDTVELQQIPEPSSYAGLLILVTAMLAVAKKRLRSDQAV